MSAFSGLGNVQQATLAMVAPGISEALVATAFGLFAAIPAVVAFNRYADQVGRSKCATTPSWKSSPRSCNGTPRAARLNTELRAMAQLTRGRRLMGEIKRRAYIDVMLVLLIIFMVTAPLLTQGIKVELPKAARSLWTRASRNRWCCRSTSKGSSISISAARPIVR